MIQPNIVLVTNIGSSHLAGLGNEARRGQMRKLSFLIHTPHCRRLFSRKNAWSIRSLMNFLEITLFV